MGSLPRTHIYRQIKSIPETHFKWIKTSEKLINVNISNHVWMLCLHFSFQSALMPAVHVNLPASAGGFFFVLLRANVIMKLVYTKDTVASVLTGIKGITVFKELQKNITDWIPVHIQYCLSCPVQDAFTITVRWTYAILYLSYSKALISHLLYIKVWDP